MLPSSQRELRGLSAQARFLIERTLGLARRGIASLRSRGWRATIDRLVLHLRPTTQPATGLYRPDDVPFTPFAVPAADLPRASIVIPDRKSTRLNSSHSCAPRMPSS